MTHRILNKLCPRNNPRNETICTCSLDKEISVTVKYDPKALDNYGMGLPVSPPDSRERTTHQQRIDEFMRKAGQDVPDSPTMPSEEVRLLRAKLIWEEVLETIQALGVDLTFGNGWMFDDQTSHRLPKMPKPTWAVKGELNLKEVADGCADISVVTIGTLSACGIADARLLEEVDRSNLSKFSVPKCTTHGCDMKYLKNTKGQYLCPVELCQSTDDGPYRSAEGKWNKGPQYSPADIAGILEKQMPPKKPERNNKYGMEPFCPFHLGDMMFHNGGGAYHCRVRDNETGEMCGYQLMPPRRKLQEKNKQFAEAYGGKQRAADDGPCYDSGGMALCAHCKGPLSDEGMKKLRAGVFSVIECPNCMKGSTLEQVENA